VDFSETVKPGRVVSTRLGNFRISRDLSWAEMEHSTLQVPLPFGNSSFNLLFHLRRHIHATNQSVGQLCSKFSHRCSKSLIFLISPNCNQIEQERALEAEFCAFVRI
jgi:hypothetical protein